MILHFNVKGADRKAMVRAIETETGERPRYLGMPSAAYEIGDYTVGRNGELSSPDGADLEGSSAVISRMVNIISNPFLSIHTVAVAVEKGLHPFQHLAVFRLLQFRVRGQKLFGGVLGFPQYPGISRQVGHAQLGQAVLPLTEKVARSPQLQIFLRNTEAVGGLGQHLQPGAGIGVAVGGEQNTVRLPFAPSHPSSQLVELRKTESVRILY